MDLFEKVDLFEKMATQLADETQVPEALEPNELTQEITSNAEARRLVMKTRANLLMLLGLTQ